MGKIKVLPQNLVNLIAAGEVVERPASALKELMENAIDAGSTKIIVNLEDYGKKLIEVKDNGVGMDTNDARLAFQQHATSKIFSEEDLQKIMTLGFRGEALASISAVAEAVTVETKARGTDAVKLTIKDGEIYEEVSAQGDHGTTLSIVNLFKNIPARKKFLKSDQVELKHLTTTFINTALTKLDINFELYHNRKVIYRLSIVKDLKDRIFEIWGSSVAKKIYTQKTFQNNDLTIEAYLGAPEIGRKTSSLQYVYLNGRFIINKTISAAVQEAYKGFIHKDLRPTYFLVIHIDPSEVDVNIHPRKTEIRLNNTQEIFKIVYSLTRKSLDAQTKNIITETFKPLIEDQSEKYKNPSGINTSSKPDFVNDKSLKSYSSPAAKIQTARSSPKIQEALSFTRALIATNYDRNAPEDTKNESMFSPVNIMQLFNTYIVFESNDKVIFLDQHAAAEKILFEKLCRELGDIKTRPLLLPEILELKPSDKELLLEKKEELQAIGIIIEDFGQSTIQVVELPELIKQLNIKEYIEEILDGDPDLGKTYEHNRTNYASLSKEIYLSLATAACHGSVRAGQKLSYEEMRNIINDLNELQNPYNCPHGRPTMWELPKYELEKNFKRKL